MNRPRLIAAAAVLAGAMAPVIADASSGMTSSYTRPVVAIPTAPGSTNAGYGTGGEPRLLVTNDGRIVVAAHMSQWDCVTGQPTPGKGHQCVWISSDGGRTFHFSGGEPNQQGDDVDLAQSGNVLLESTMTNKGVGTGAGGTTVTRSTDGGRTWGESVDVDKTVVNDRPFMLASPDGGLLLTYDQLPGGIFAVRSTDQGATWGLPQPIVPEPTVVAVLNGAPAIDAARHQILVPFAVSTAPDCASGAAGCINSFSLARGGYDGTTWTREPVITYATGTGGQSVAYAAADSAGTDYYVTGIASNGDGSTAQVDRDAHIMLSVQQRGTSAWTTHQVDPPQGGAMIPNLVAGAAGRVVVAYYWSPYADAQSHNRPWYVVVADSHDSGRTFSRTVVSKVVWVGSGMNHQKVLWDLFGLALDAEDRVNVAWTQVNRYTPAGPLTEIAFARQR